MIYAFANRLVAENTNRFAKKWVGLLRFNKIIAKALFEKYIRSIVYFVTFLDAMKSGLKAERLALDGHNRRCYIP